MTRASLTARQKARLKREREWLEAEVAAARSLTDEDRVDILCDLSETVDAIRATKSEEELERQEEVRRELDRPGKDRYRALAERVG